MAEDKKKEESSPLINKNEVIFLLAGLFVLALIVNQIIDYFYYSGWGTTQNFWNYFLHSYFYPFWGKWKIFAAVVSAASLVWAVYSRLKLKKIEEEEEKIYGHLEHDTFLEELKDDKSNQNEKWLKVMEWAYSENPADWRLAIMEADVMLEDVLRKSGYPGDTIGEMLKSAGGADQFLSLDAAWEAHKVRNNIAHGGSDYQLSERETRRAIGLFEQVFREFGVI